MEEGGIEGKSHYAKVVLQAMTMIKMCKKTSWMHSCSHPSSYGMYKIEKHVTERGLEKEALKDEERCVMIVSKVGQMRV